MKMLRYPCGLICLVLLFAVVNGGCWGRKFFRMPRETLATSTKVDSLLRENAYLQRRVYRLERTLADQKNYSRSVNAQLKLDLEELMDQMNALHQMLREAGYSSTYQFDRGRIQVPDTAGMGIQAGEGAGDLAEGGIPGEGIETPRGEGVSPDTTLPEPGMASPETLAGPGERPAGAADSTLAYGGETVPPPEEIRRQMYLDFSRGDYRLALEESDIFLEEYPDHPLSEEVYFIRGECFVEQDKHFDALREFTFILQQYPRGKRAPAVLLRMAVSYEKIGEKEIAAGVVRRLLKEYPYSEEAAAAEERFKELLGD